MMNATVRHLPQDDIRFYEACAGALECNPAFLWPERIIGPAVVLWECDAGLRFSRTYRRGTGSRVAEHRSERPPIICWAAWPTTEEGVGRDAAPFNVRFQ
jgi:hypothetical protein